MKQCEANKNLWRLVLVAQLGKSLDCEQRSLTLKFQCQSPTFAWKSKLKWEKALPTMLTIKRLAGIAPSGESQGSIAHRQRSIQVNGTILALKPRADIIRSPKQSLAPFVLKPSIERNYINNFIILRSMVNYSNTELVDLNWSDMMQHITTCLMYQDSISRHALCSMVLRCCEITTFCWLV